MHIYCMPLFSFAVMNVQLLQSMSKAIKVSNNNLVVYFITLRNRLTVLAFPLRTASNKKLFLVSIRLFKIMV